VTNTPVTSQRAVAAKAHQYRMRDPISWSKTLQPAGIQTVTGLIFLRGWVAQRHA
jgi:hypothetical protein